MIKIHEHRCSAQYTAVLEEWFEFNGGVSAWKPPPGENDHEAWYTPRLTWDGALHPCPNPCRLRPEPVDALTELANVEILKTVDFSWRVTHVRVRALECLITTKTPVCTLRELQKFNVGYHFGLSFEDWLNVDDETKALYNLIALWGENYA